ncbi:hypothetical protein RHMOL_Rhmol04G0220000 [Rhododendron molle]|uniref:Uncharacterized protein n=1 Tax=Rhododendron molle TaxID=49168 RepID=A0ACC0P4M6_RHOML|nr:hypothetical protein RHMOL_Rhmol04G0220000 [Rhododendron molle]
MVGRVEWNPWGGVVPKPEYMARSKAVTASQVLFESAFGWHGTWATRQVHVAELQRFTILADLSAFLRLEHDYAIYRRQYLAGPLGVMTRQRGAESATAREEMSFRIQLRARPTQKGPTQKKWKRLASQAAESKSEEREEENEGEDKERSPCNSGSDDSASGQINIMCLIETYSPNGDLDNDVVQARRRFALVICLLAAYLLIPANGRVSPLLVSIVAQLGTRRNMIPLVLTEMLLGLDLPDEIAWRCSWLDVPNMATHSDGFDKMVIAGLTRFMFYIPSRILRQLGICQENNRISTGNFHLPNFNAQTVNEYQRC